MSRKATKATKQFHFVYLVTLWDIFLHGLNFPYPKLSILHKIYSMKITSLILFLFCFMITAAAQVERKPAVVTKTDTVSFSPAGKNDQKSRKDMLKELDLTKEQRSKLKEIRRENMAKKEAIENNSQLTEQEKKKQLKDLQQEQAKNIQAILTDEQKEKFKAKRQELKKKNN